MNQALQNRSRTQILARRLPIDLAIVTVFNIAIAIALTYLMRIGTSFYQNLVFSLCIGTLSLIFVDGPRLLLWGEGRPPKLPFFLVLAIANPIAWYLGIETATRILGIPPGSFALVHAKNTTAFVIFFALTCAFITWFFWNRGRLQLLKAESEAEKARTTAIEKQAMQAQLQLLQAQVEPHMLFNTLANLQSLIAVDTTRAQHLLEQLIQYLRATLSSSRAKETTLAQEFSLMDAYLGLMSLRMGPRLSYALELPKGLRMQPIPPMLLQPLVENAIKHGLESKIDGGRIEVQASRQEGTLTLTVADTGLGLDASSSDTAGTRLGVSNVRERLQALYGERASFSLTSNTPTGVIAQLTIPL